MAELQHSPERGGDAGGLYAVLIILAILILAAVLYFSGAFGGAGDQASPTTKNGVAAPDTAGAAP
jgi:hypothetical protein